MDAPLTIDNLTKSKIIEKIRKVQSTMKSKLLKLIRYGGDKDLTWFLSLSDSYLFNNYGITKEEKKYMENNQNLFSLFKGGFEFNKKIFGLLIVGVLFLIAIIVLAATDNMTGCYIVLGCFVLYAIGAGSYARWQYKKNNPVTVAANFEE